MQQDDAGPGVFPELREQLGLQFLEIPKAFRLWTGRQLPQDDVKLGAWLGFLADPANPDLEEASMSIPELKDAKHTLEEISADDEARELARIREKSRLHYESTLAEAKEEGLAQGLEVGRAEGKAEGLKERSLIVLKSLLAGPEASMFTDQRLAEITGLELDDIMRIRHELNTHR